MKSKFLVGVLALVFMASICLAVGTSTAPGFQQTLPSVEDTYGAYSFQGNRVYRFVINSSGTEEFTGQPVFFDPNHADSWHYGYCTSTASRSAFGGIVVSDIAGNTTIAEDELMMVCISGTIEAYISREATAIAVGDILWGQVPLSIANTAGQTALTRLGAWGEVSPCSVEVISLGTDSTTGSALSTVLVRAKF